MSQSVVHLLGLHPSSEELVAYIDSLAKTATKPSPNTFPQIKSYPDAVYLNYFDLGLSLLFKPAHGYKPHTGPKLSELNDEKLILESIDIYNIPKPPSLDSSQKRTSRSELAFSPYPALPLVLPVTPKAGTEKGKGEKRQNEIRFSATSSGKEIVQVLGEPDRKGGGAGPSSGSIGIWCEWSKDGMMIEFGGSEATGPQAWERGKDAVWKVVTVFPPKT